MTATYGPQPPARWPATTTQPPPKPSSPSYTRTFITCGTQPPVRWPATRTRLPPKPSLDSCTTATATCGTQPRTHWPTARSRPQPKPSPPCYATATASCGPLPPTRWPNGQSHGYWHGFQSRAFCPSAENSQRFFSTLPSGSSTVTTCGYPPTIGCGSGDA